MLSKATTTSPFAATAPALRPVRPPDGTRATWFSLANRTTACTCSVVFGSTIASGLGGYILVQSLPYVSRSEGSVNTLPGFSPVATSSLREAMICSELMGASVSSGLGQGLFRIHSKRIDPGKPARCESLRLWYHTAPVL